MMSLYGNILCMEDIPRRLDTNNYVPLLSKLILNGDNPIFRKLNVLQRKKILCGAPLLIESQLEIECRKYPWKVLDSALCEKNNEESTNHLFLNCSFSSQVWSHSQALLNLRFDWLGQSLEDAWKVWSSY